MSILTTIATVAVGTLIPGVGIALAIWKLGAKEALKRAGDVATYLFAHPMTAVAIAAGLLALFYWQDARHWKKADTSHAATLAAVKVEVDRGVGKATKPEDAPFYIRRFVDNVWTLDGALTRQSAALEAAKTDANAHDDDAHKQGQPTADEAARDWIRKQLQDPARVDGADTDWGKL